MSRSNQLRVQGGQWVDDLGRFHAEAVSCRDGVFWPGTGEGDPSAPSLDASSCIIFPGLVDPHVHLREPGQAAKEGIENGTLAALAGGVTTILDMPNNRPPTTTPARLAAKRKRFERCALTRFGLFQMATMKGPLVPAPDAVAAKVYLSRASSAAPVTTLERLVQIFVSFPIVALHAEHDSRLRPTGRHHHERRPEAALAEGLLLASEALRSVPVKQRPRLVLCHVSTALEVEWLKAMKRDFDVWGEVCPHYLLLTSDDAVAAGGRLQVNPPLRQPSDREALWEALLDGTLDFLATDHAPHTPGEKSAPHPPSGMPGVEWLGPFLVSLAAAGRIPWGRAVAIGSANAAACYRLAHAGALTPGGSADFALYAPLPNRPLQTITRAGYCPYPDFPFTHFPVATVVGGEVRFRQGEQ